MNTELMNLMIKRRCKPIGAPPNSVLQEVLSLGLLTHQNIKVQTSDKKIKLKEARLIQPELIHEINLVSY